jgi:hypothetical protein
MNIVVHVDLNSLGPTCSNDIVQSSTQSPAELYTQPSFKKCLLFLQKYAIIAVDFICDTHTMTLMLASIF